MSSEKDLVAGCKRKEPRAQEALYKLYKGRMMALCLRYFSPRTIAEEVFQEGFIRFFTYIQTFDDARPLYPWMKKLFIRAGSNYLRQFERGNEEEHRVSMEELPDLSNDDYKGLFARLSYEELLEFMGQLPEPQRIILNMALVEDFSHAEIAEILNISEGASRVRLLRAREAFIQILSLALPTIQNILQ